MKGLIKKLQGKVTQKTRDRREKVLLRWQKQRERQKALNRKIREVAEDILQSENFKSTKAHIQHGTMSVNDHCKNVAKYSLAISEKLHIPCNQRELIRGALLHDYFLYDWHSKEHVPLYKLHGFFHPGVALRNASKEYKLTPREKDIIKKHMWPLTVVPPAYREAWIVTAADKWCSLLETLHIHKGREAGKSKNKCLNGVGVLNKFDLSRKLKDKNVRKRRTVSTTS